MYGVSDWGYSQLNATGTSDGRFGGPVLTYPFSFRPRNPSILRQVLEMSARCAPALLEETLNRDMVLEDLRDKNKST